MHITREHGLVLTSMCIDHPPTLHLRCTTCATTFPPPSGSVHAKLRFRWCKVSTRWSPEDAHQLSPCTIGRIPCVGTMYILRHIGVAHVVSNDRPPPHHVSAISMQIAIANIFPVRCGRRQATPLFDTSTMSRVPRAHSRCSKEIYE